MTNDSRFITNQEKQTLLERFRILIKDTKFFDCLVGYFYISGFQQLYEPLEKTKKIRILVGISTNQQILDLIQQANDELRSHATIKEQYGKLLKTEIDNQEESSQLDASVQKFLEWLKSGKLEIKAYPTNKLHAKLYIMSFGENNIDAGRIITGSSNFTQSGLKDNLEFNVELKDKPDYQFAKEKFAELWEEAVDLKETCLKTIQEKTYFKQNILPYQLYLKCLYEYFKDDLKPQSSNQFSYFPEGFKQLVYQDQAVFNAKKILEEYGGVFISDVVGLGKTYVASMLASQLEGRHLVLAPPLLIDYWFQSFNAFNVRASARFKSLGQLERLAKENTSDYENVFIDESHRFRVESNPTYEYLAKICRGKKIILITATPFNNKPSDLLSQIKLFQNARASTIPNKPDLEYFFNSLEGKLKKLDRQSNQIEYLEITKTNAQTIRESVLKYLMVRRTRNEIATYFKEDLQKNDLQFPEVADPEPAYYQLNEIENKIFDNTLTTITKDFKYARYIPLLYLKEVIISATEKQGQLNLSGFMKILLIKRLESSFHAFRETITRFIKYHELFLANFEKGKVYLSKKNAYKIFELLDNDNDEAIQKIIDEGKATEYKADEFKPEFKADLQQDLLLLKKIDKDWETITRDPKLITFIDKLKKHPILKKEKLIIFSESKETAEYLAKELSEKLKENILQFNGSSKPAERDKVIANFDANSKEQKNDYRLLITTEVLAEGVNLHRSNVIINYDLPWNPTRLMQRAGRINRLDTKFKNIYIFNFFPTEQSNDQIKLKEAAESKIASFINLLGTDSKLLTESETIESHQLFEMLTSKKNITGEDEDEISELKYLQIIRKIRDENPELFKTIMALPKKARTAKQANQPSVAKQLLSYFRKGRIQKFFSKGKELDFLTAIALLEAKPDVKPESLPKDFYEKLESNKYAFKSTTSPVEQENAKTPAKQGKISQIIRILKTQEKDIGSLPKISQAYVTQCKERLLAGAFPDITLQKLNKNLHNLVKSGELNLAKILETLKKIIPVELLEKHSVEVNSQQEQTESKQEIILSEYLI